MASVGSPRMVDIVGRLPTQGGRPAIDVRISTEFREWLLAMWRRTGGDGDMVDDVTTTALTAATAAAGLAGRVAAVEDLAKSLDAERALWLMARAPATSSFMRTVLDDGTAVQAQQTLKLSRAKLDFIYG
jgi:hypothetical protein